MEGDVEPCRLRGRLEAAARDVPVPERRPVVRREHRLGVLGEGAPQPKGDQLVAEVGGDRKAADTGWRLRRAVLARPRPLAPDVEEGLVLVEVAPLEAEHFAKPEA